jgi:hypothetical protein
MENDSPKMAVKEAVPSNPAGEITVVCCYCQTIMEVKKGMGVSGISHGICYSCFIKARDNWKEEIDSYQRKFVGKNPKEHLASLKEEKDPKKV